MQNLKKMKLKLILINVSLFVILYLISDLIFSNFFFKQSVDHKCYEHTNDGSFYQMRKNCFSNMKLISSIDSFKMYTNEEGRRFFGKKEKVKKKSVIFFRGLTNIWSRIKLGKYFCGNIRKTIYGL